MQGSSYRANLIVNPGLSQVGKMMLRSPNLYNISTGDEPNRLRSGLHDSERPLGTFVHAYISIRITQTLPTQRTLSCWLWQQRAKAGDLQPV